MPICCRTAKPCCRLPAGPPPAIRSAARSARGEAIRIFTGAPMPEGADTVMMQEDCVVEDGRVRLKPGIRKGANRRHAGEDVAEGAVALAAGRRLGAGRSRSRRRARPRRAAGLPAVARRRCCRPATRSASPGTPLPPGAIYDANRFMLAALLRGLGCAVSDFGIRPDREAALADTLAAASAGHDLIVTSGGVSTGEEDHVKSAIETARAGSISGGWRSSRGARSRSARSAACR